VRWRASDSSVGIGASSAAGCAREGETCTVSFVLNKGGERELGTGVTDREAPRRICRCCCSSISRRARGPIGLRCFSMIGTFATVALWRWGAGKGEWGESGGGERE